MAGDASMARIKMPLQQPAMTRHMCPSGGRYTLPPPNLHASARLSLPRRPCARLREASCIFAKGPSITKWIDLTLATAQTSVRRGQRRLTGTGRGGRRAARGRVVEPGFVGTIEQFSLTVPRDGWPLRSNELARPFHWFAHASWPFECEADRCHTCRKGSGVAARVRRRPRRLEFGGPRLRRVTLG